MAILNKQLKRSKKNGFSLIEVLIAMFIVAVVGVGFLLTLQYALKANIFDDTKSTAESLARSQLENIKKEAYLDFSVSSIPSADRLKATYDVLATSGDYQISVTVEPINPIDSSVYIATSHSPEIFPTDQGIQKITVKVEFNTSGNPNIWDGSVTVEGYKVDR